MHVQLFPQRGFISSDHSDPFVISREINDGLLQLVVIFPVVMEIKAVKLEMESVKKLILSDGFNAKLNAAFICIQ